MTRRRTILIAMCVAATGIAMLVVLRYERGASRSPIASVQPSPPIAAAQPAPEPQPRRPGAAVPVHQGPLSGQPALEPGGPPRSRPRPSLPAGGGSRGAGSVEDLRMDIIRRSGRPAETGVEAVIGMCQAGRGKDELLAEASRRIENPLQRLIVDGWIRDRYDPPRGPSALGAGGAEVHVPAMEAVR